MITAVIKSSRDGRTLTFSEREGDYFKVAVGGGSVSAIKKVWGYTDTSFLVDLFTSIARDWKGWTGERHWESIEGDLKVSASSDKLGHIRLETEIKNHDPEDDWRIQVPVYLDAGSLDTIAKSIDHFFNQK